MCTERKRIKVDGKTGVSEALVYSIFIKTLTRKYNSSPKMQTSVNTTLICVFLQESV